MSKTISEIRDEIASFYLASQSEVTDVSTGSVAGGLLYAVSAGIKTIYDQLDEVERQAYIATATGKYLDLLIEGGFNLSRKKPTRSSGYVLVYGDEPILSPEATQTSLILADYDYESGLFLSGTEDSIKFSGENEFGSTNVAYSLVKPKNSQYYKRDSRGRYIIDFNGKSAQYLILPVASLLTGRQVNLKEGYLNTFTKPPVGLKYVSNIYDVYEYVFNIGGVSSAPIYSRNTSIISFNAGTRIFSVINAFNFSRTGFIDISYKARFPTRLIRAEYKNISGNTVSGGLSFEYSDRTQTSISLKSSKAIIKRFEDNLLSEYKLERFDYFDASPGGNGLVEYFVDASDVWRASKDITLSGGALIGPSTPVVGLGSASGSSIFFSQFFGRDNWVVQQTRDQISDDVIFDPDSVLNESFQIKDEYRLSRAQDSMGDTQYREYFKNYINSLSKATGNSLEFGALQVNGITFSRVLPRENSPVGAAVLLASSEDGQLTEEKRKEVFNYLKDDWVASGINLIVRPPDLLGVKISISISLTNPDLENSVKSNISSSLNNYLSSKNPGSEIKYGEIYSIVNSVFGVKNVSKLLVGRRNASHYTKYPYNYANLAIEKAVSYRNEAYEYSDDVCFFDERNNVIISTDINGVGVTLVPYSEYDDTLSKESIFGFGNRKLYVGIEGLFSSDGGGSVASSSSYIKAIYEDIPHLENDNTLGIRFTVSSTDAPLSLHVNGIEANIENIGDSGFFKNCFVTLPATSTDVVLEFSSSSSSFTVSEIQTFLHDDSLDSYLVSDYNEISYLDFLDKTKFLYIYDITTTSKRFKTLKGIRVLNYLEEPRLRDLMSSLIQATCTQFSTQVLDSCSLNLYQSILRDFQYGINLSGKNLSFFKDTFADISKSDEPFKYFMVYSSSAPLSSKFDEFYPLSPSSSTAELTGDYTLSSTQLSRFQQNIFNPKDGLSPSIAFEGF
jgi:uncharacterized phage protein gp47/JayE